MSRYSSMDTMSRMSAEYSTRFTMYFTIIFSVVRGCAASYCA